MTRTISQWKWSFALWLCAGLLVASVVPGTIRSTFPARQIQLAAKVIF